MKLLDFVLQEIRKHGYTEKSVKELQDKYKMQVFRDNQLITGSFEVFKAIAPGEVKSYAEQQVKMLQMPERLMNLENNKNNRPTLCRAVLLCVPSGLRCTVLYCV